MPIDTTRLSVVESHFSLTTLMVMLKLKLHEAEAYGVSESWLH